MEEEKLKFEYPNGIIKPIKIKDLDGTVMVANLKAFDEIYDNDFKERSRVLDLAFSIEFAIDQIICYRISEDFFIHDFLEDILLSRIDLMDKREILRSILLEDEYFHSDSLNFKHMDEKNLKIDNFKLKINPFLEIIKEVIEIRNNIAHQKRPVFSVRGTIIKYSKTHFAKLSEINKEEFMINGHFVLWILNSICKDNYIEGKALEAYFVKYKDILNYAELIVNK